MYSNTTEANLENSLKGDLNQLFTAINRKVNTGRIRAFY